MPGRPSHCRGHCGLWPISLSVLWGGSFFFAKVALEELGPSTVVFVRVSLAALALALVVPLRRDAPWPTYFAMGLLTGLWGVAVLIGPAALASDAALWGQAACLAAGLSHMLSPASAAGQVTASAVLILPIMLVVDQPWLLSAAPSLAVCLAVAGPALLSTALAYVLYFRILFLIPVTAVLLGAVVLGERWRPGTSPAWP